MKRPNHSTVVAYLALFIALATGGAWAATTIKSTKQIKNGAVRSADVKDENLKGADIGQDAISASELAAGAVGAGEIADGSVGAGEIADGSVGGSEITADSIGGGSVADRSLSGADLGLDSLGAAEIAEESLGLANVESQVVQASDVPIDDGGLLGVPRTPQGDILSVSVPRGGPHLLIAHASLTADGNGSGVLCSLSDGSASAMDTGAFVDETDYAGGGFVDHTPVGVSASTVVSPPGPFTAKFFCADNGGMARSPERSIAAISLAG